MIYRCNCLNFGSYKTNFLELQPKITMHPIHPRQERKLSRPKLQQFQANLKLLSLALFRIALVGPYVTLFKVALKSFLEGGLMMGMTQAEDFRAESEALYELLSKADAAHFDEPTQFKNWTINAVLQHLHFWNQMAGFQITDETELTSRMKAVGRHTGGMRGFEAEHFTGLSGRNLLEAWHDEAQSTATLFAGADPKARLKWAGPDMSARSSITARLMETWAHGQEIYDHLGEVRLNKDRIRNIVVLGVNTFGWTYKTRREAPPGAMPHLILEAPSGEIWTYGDPSEREVIKGLAEEFCQVVTQTRNIADTSLVVTGPVANDWMSKAQCFAGAPETQPAPGTRRTTQKE
jgi:uncharacterized protein (TIGR03084 family)